MKMVHIDTVEWWPVYTIEYVDDYGHPASLSEELIARAEKAFAEFYEVQGLLEEAYDRV